MLLDRLENKFEFEVEELFDQKTETYYLNSVHINDFDDIPGQKIFFNNGEIMFRYFKKSVEYKRVTMLNDNSRKVELFDDSINGPHYVFIRNNVVEKNEDFFYAGKKVSEHSYNILRYSDELEETMPINNVSKRVNKF